MLAADDIARLYAAHSRPLVAFFARRTFDAQVAAELMAETFAAAVADRRAFRGGGDDAASAWLYGIARHQLSHWYRRASVERRALAKLGLDPPGLTDIEYERIEDLTRAARPGTSRRWPRVADELPGLDPFGEALVAAVRREDGAPAWAGEGVLGTGVGTKGQTSVAVSYPPLPALDRIGRDLAARTRRQDRRRGRARRFGIALGVVLPIAATSGAATAVVLREAVIPAPDPAHVPDEQTPLAGTAVVSSLRAADPGNGLPWTVRVARSKTGFTCTTVGQVDKGVFGLTGLDGVFRRLPAELSDACGQGGTLTGARALVADRVRDARTIVYGAAGEQLRSATLTTAGGSKRLEVGPGGTYVAVLRGYPEDSAVGVSLGFADRRERHNFGASRDTTLDAGGGQAWRTDRYAMGARRRCARLRTARPDPLRAATGPVAGPSTPTACLGLRSSERDWVADARTFGPGDRGVPGFDRWDWLDLPARTVVWGVSRENGTLREVTLRGAGAPRKLTITRQGAFSIVLPASVDPRKLTLEVRLADGRTQRGRPGEGLTPDPVKSRRPR